MGIVNREPVAAGALARLVLAFAGRYGFELSIDEILALMGAAEVLLAILTRNRVSPVPK